MINFRKAKIVAKIADNRCEVPFLKSIFDAGADVAWLNTAHQDEAATIEVIKKIQSLSPLIPIMIDTKGPEIRTKNVAAPVPVTAGSKIILTGDLKKTGENVINVSYPHFHEEVPVGESILYDDASIEFVVTKKLPDGIECEVKSSGVIKNKKSLNIPNVHIKLPALSEKDRSFIHFCAKHNVDYIAHSFVRSKEDLFEIEDILKEYPSYRGKIISKIENREGFTNLQEILEHSDGLMVARGDLGAEVLIEEVPYMQKKMVEMALHYGKYCIVATQALESMIKNPRPTRAEITDVANAVLDGSGAMSMSGETAYGDFPVEATKTMGRIMKYIEKMRDDLIHFTALPKVKSSAYTAAKDILSKAHTAKAIAIIVVSDDLEISRALSAHRPAQLIIPLLSNEEDYRESLLAYAVRPIFAKKADVADALQQIKLSGEKGKVLVVEDKTGKMKFDISTETI